MVMYMREMKDSGLPWLGKIPSEWRYIKLKTYYSFEKGKNAQKYTVDYIGQHDGQYPVYSGQTENNGVMGTIDSFDYDIPECLFSTTVGAKVMTPKILSGKFSLSQNCLIMKQVKECNNHFMFYYLHPLFDYEKGSIPSYMQPSLRVEDLKKYGFFIPDIFEQKCIADFLDSKCAEIDALSADIQSEIDTLETYKRSVITETVTKGLDKTVPMKDSGIEWVGEIPANWVMQRGKYVFEQKSDRGNSKSLVLLSPTQNYGVIPQDLYEELSGFSAVKLNEKTDLNSLKTVHKGAFVISLRSFQGGFEYSEYEGVVSPAYQVFYPTIPVCDRYYKYLFKTQIFIDKMNSYTMSLRDGKNIAFADFGRTYIPIPPVDEQTRIANYLDDICTQLNDVIIQKQEQLAVLANYKKSVIFEYVTGKKEVSYGNI